MSDESKGRVLKLMVCDKADSIASTPVDEIDVTLEGFVGDKHSGFTKPSDGRTKFYPRGTTIRNNRQISIVSKEELDILCNSLDISTLNPEWMGANLLIGGISDLTALPTNTRLFFSSGAVLMVTSDNLPCAKLTEEVMKHITDRDDLEDRIIPMSMKLRGIVAVVELAGKIKKGDELRVVYSRG